MPRRLQCIFCQTAFVVGDEAPLGDCPGCGTELLDSTYIVDLGPITENHIALDATKTLQEVSTRALDPTATLPGGPELAELDVEPPELSGEDVTRASLSAGSLAAAVASGEPQITLSPGFSESTTSYPDSDPFDAGFDDVTPSGALPMPKPSPTESGGEMKNVPTTMETPNADDDAFAVATRRGNGQPAVEPYGEDDTNLNKVEPAAGEPAVNEPAGLDPGDKTSETQLPLDNDTRKQLPALDLPAQPWELEQDAAAAAAAANAPDGAAAADSLAELGDHAPETEADDDDAAGFYVEDEHTLSSNLDLEALAAASTNDESGARPRWRCSICSAEFPGSRPRTCPACGSQVSAN
jgi:hypothetical protein